MSDGESMEYDSFNPLRLINFFIMDIFNEWSHFDIFLFIDGLEIF